jgi:F-box and leucine-rich repeat protein 1 (S-phase kinase-associated protein 2)
MGHNWRDCLNTVCYMCLYYLPASGHFCAIHVSCYCRQLSSVSSLMYLDVFNLMSEQSLANLQDNLREVDVNKFLFSSVARPTVGIRRTIICGLRVRD